MSKHQNTTPKKHTAKAHRAILLEELKTHPVDTFQARDELDIQSPAPRIFELRHNEGYNIVTQWVTKQGHRIGQYVLNKTFVQADLFEGVAK